MADPKNKDKYIYRTSDKQLKHIRLIQNFSKNQKKDGVIN